MPKIGKRCVDSAGVEAERYIVWDDEIKGFGLLVLPTGVKSYLYQYRTPEGRQRRITIGQHGSWTPTKAREKAEAHRDTVRAGGDPLGEKRATKEAPTVGDILDAYLVSESFKDKALSTQSIDRGRIERHLRPLLGKRHVHLLTDNGIRKAFADIRDGKTRSDIKTKKRGRAIVKGGQGAARMAVNLLRAAFNWAIVEKLLPKGSNPCDLIKTGSSGTRDTILETTDDYVRLFETLERMETERRIRSPIADAIRLIALTGCRRGEAAGLRWCYVDAGKITLPPSSHKTGKQTGKPRVIGLPSVAQEIIARQSEGGPSDFVFKPAKGRGAAELTRVWRKVREEAKLPPTLGLHGLRHTVGSQLAWNGAGAPEIMTALGHRQMSTVVRYIHWAERARSTLAEKAAAPAVAGMAAAAKAGRLKGGRS
jgi:integrase